jgi:hypothetical protein
MARIGLQLKLPLITDLPEFFENEAVRKNLPKGQDITRFEGMIRRYRDFEGTYLLRDTENNHLIRLHPKGDEDPCDVVHTAQMVIPLNWYGFLNNDKTGRVSIELEERDAEGKIVSGTLQRNVMLDAGRSKGSYYVLEGFQLGGLPVQASD